jgi:cytoskeletal protein CcmA (bactofilin family)
MRMFNSKPDATPTTAAAADRKRSVIAEDIVIEGNIISQGILEFGGQITGDVTADAVVLTPAARVRGRVRARQLTIEGELQGAATALNVNIKTGARVKANFAYETLEVASGAQVDGEYKRISADSFKL